MTETTIVKFEHENRADIARAIAPHTYEVVLAAYFRGEEGPQSHEYNAFAGYVRDGASIRFKSISARSGEDAISVALAAIVED